MKEGEGYSLVLDYLMLEAREVLLPLVEQIDPALVPELFWRVVATRPSIGNPRDVPGDIAKHWSSRLVAVLGWYDRDVAAALFEPIRVQLEHTDDLALARSREEFLAWSIFDPRAAVARLKQVPVDPKLELSRATSWQISGCRNARTLPRETLAIELARLDGHERTDRVGPPASGEIADVCAVAG